MSDAVRLDLRYHTSSNEITIRVTIAADSVRTLTGTDQSDNSVETREAGPEHLLQTPP